MSYKQLINYLRKIQVLEEKHLVCYQKNKFLNKKNQSLELCLKEKFQLLNLENFMIEGIYQFEFSIVEEDENYDGNRKYLNQIIIIFYQNSLMELDKSKILIDFYQLLERYNYYKMEGQKYYQLFLNLLFLLKVFLLAALNTRDP